MKRLLFLSVLCVLASTVFAGSGIKLDAKDDDWAMEHILISDRDNLQDYFPAEVGASFSDRVDVKEVKAAIIENRFYFFLRFWGGPVWPNQAYSELLNGQTMYRHRGYYHLMVDLDNNKDTGWNSWWYETHYTPLGYYASKALPSTDAIGAEIYLELGIDTKWTKPKEDGSYKKISYAAYDVSEIDYHAGTGNESDICNIVAPAPDSAKAMKWEGNGLDDVNNKYYYWAGHAWGSDFLEYGIEMSLIQAYWQEKGKNYLKAGDVIGICSFVETPVDDWGVDVSNRGQLTVPSATPRPSAITFDGKADEWAGKPALVNSLDDLQDYFPAEVGASFSDRVDMKEIKAFIDPKEDMFYFNIKFWGSPVWPNQAYSEELNGVKVYRHRGYYHLMVDLDNDANTGWNSWWYETHYTTLGYYASKALPNTNAIGAEIYLEMGIDTKWTKPKEDGSYKKVSHAAYDVSEIDYHAGTGNESDICDYIVMAPDSVTANHFDGYMYDDISEDGNLYYAGHAWGTDFLEFGITLTQIRQYWAAKGMNYLNPGDAIGICGFVETPVDDWGVDVTPRGEVVVPGGLKPPASVKFDGDASDWANRPVLVNSVDDLQDYFPAEVGASFSDRVDMKEIKAFYSQEEDVFYFNMKFWGSPVWPNQAYSEELNGVKVYRHRGYYHLMIDLDNNANTGWNSWWYETHYTTLGYYASKALANTAAIGAEVYLELGIDTKWTVPKEDGTVKKISYATYDVSEIDYHAGTGNESDISSLLVPNPSPNRAMGYSGYMLDDVNSPADTTRYFGGHAWGDDFLEYGVSMTTLRKYWEAKGTPYLKPGDTIGFCGFVETPVDDWGVDVTPRGELTLGTATAVEEKDQMQPDQYVLGQNYPNPFNPETSIGYSVPVNERVTLEVFNLLGQKVVTLVDQFVNAGQHTIMWNGKDDQGHKVASGVYLYILRTKTTQFVKKMTLMQ